MKLLTRFIDSSVVCDPKKMLDNVSVDVCKSKLIVRSNDFNLFVILGPRYCSNRQLIVTLIPMTTT